MTDRNHPNATSDPNPESDPGIDSVYRFLTYALSLPERAVRGTTAVVSGLIQETAQLLVPSAFQNSRTYRVFVSQMLEFLAKDVGGVRRESKGDSASEAGAESSTPVEGFVARKAVGNFIELAGLATIHLSPLTILAIVSDVAYGSKVYLRELAAELQKQGIIDEKSTINSVQDLLESVSRASGVTAQSLDLPPLTLAEIRKSLTQTVKAVSEIDVRKALPQSEIDKLWRDMKSVGEKQNVSLFQMGSAMAMYSVNQLGGIGKGAMTSVQVAGIMVDRTIFEHYRVGLVRIAGQGFYPFLRESSQPYFDAVWHNFSTARPTVTEDLLHGRTSAKLWRTVRGWFGNSGDPSAPG